jgi:hypothetical protein
MTGLMVLLVPPNSKNHLNPLEYFRETLPFFRRDEKVEMIIHYAEVPQLKLEVFGGFSFRNHGEKEFFHFIWL